MSYINNLGGGIKSRVGLFADDTILYPTIKTPTDSTPLQNNFRTLESWGRRWLISLIIVSQLVLSAQSTTTDDIGTDLIIEKCLQQTVTKKRNRIPTSYALHGQTLERDTGTKYHGVECTENLRWGKHILSSPSKANTSECLHIEKPEGMPTCCPDTVLQRSYVISARVRICVAEPPSATSEIHVGNGAAMISLLHP